MLVALEEELLRWEEEREEWRRGGRARINERRGRRRGLGRQGQYNPY